MPRYSAGHKCNGAEAKMWSEIRTMKEFTRKSLAYKTGIERQTVMDYTNRLVKAGFLEIVRQTKINTGLNEDHLKLIKDQGVDTPRLRKNGSIVPTSINQKIWQSIRILKNFSIDELCISVPQTTKVNIKTYISFLCRAGYLKRLGKPKSICRYILIASKVNGAKAPLILRIKKVYDPNINEVVWPLEDIS